MSKGNQAPAMKGFGPGPKGQGPGGKPKNTKVTLKRLFKYLEQDKLKLFFVFVCVILAAFANLAGSYMLRPIINGLGDSFLEYQVSMDKAAVLLSATNSLIKKLITMASIYIISVIATYLQQRIMIGISQNSLQTIRNDLFCKVQKLPVRFYDTNNHGELMSRFTNDVDTISNALQQSFSQILNAILGLSLAMFKIGRAHV